MIPVDPDADGNPYRHRGGARQWPRNHPATQSLAVNATLATNSQKATDRMKAARITQHGGPEVIELVELPMPEPGPGTVRLKVEAGGMNYSDLMICRGSYLDTVNLPYVLGREACGTIDALGPDTAGMQVGQRVVTFATGGAFAEYMVVPAMSLLPCPEGLTPQQGAAILVQGITAIHCLHDLANVQAGEVVLVHAAAGGVGTLAIQIAIAAGAKVFGTASSETKCEVIRSLGATAINYATGDWVAAFREANNGRGANVILECVGGDVYRRSFFDALSPFGRMVVYGIASGDEKPISNREILGSNKALFGYFLGAYMPRHADKVIGAAFRLNQLIAQGAVRPITGDCFPLSRIRDAFELMQSRASIGKVVIEP